MTRPSRFLCRALVTATLLGLGCPGIAVAQAADRDAKSLILDDGRYEESSWARQLAVTADDRYLISSDFKHGIRIHDLANGELINSMEGHALEGDAYYNARAHALVTTGDRKIKIWDVDRQRLLKTIQQPFHSQFMQNVYIDSTRQFVFAQGVKYRADTGKLVKRYEPTGIDRLANRYFFQDRYYLFNERTGQMQAYDCFTDQRLAVYTLDQYRQGTDLYFDNRDGHLFIGYETGVRVVDITSGRSDFASFDRAGAFRNGETSSYAVSADGNYLVAGSTQGVGLVVLKKLVAGTAFAGNTREVLRQRIVIGEVHALHASNRVVYTTEEAIHMLDLATLRPRWERQWQTLGLRNIHMAPDGSHLYIDFGSRSKINRHWFARTFPYRFDAYFDEIDANWGTFKSTLKDADLPKDLLPMWRERPQTARLRLDGDVALEPASAKLPFPMTGTAATPHDPVEGSVASPSGRYTFESKDFGSSTLYERGRPIGRAPDLGVIYHVEYSHDERYLAVGGSTRWVAVLDLSTGKVLHKVYAEGYVTSISFSSDHEHLFTGSLKNEIIMWRLKDGRLVRKFTGSNGAILDTEVAPDGKRLVSIADDGALRFWDISTGNLLVSAIFIYAPSAKAPQGSVRQSPWVVVTPEGRFDTNDLDEVRGLHWIVPDDPLHPLPLEIFMRDYYEPRLLARVLAAEKFAPIRPLATLNRVQPKVRIVRTQIENAAEGLVAVTVEVADDKRRFERDGQVVERASGAYDLRLFRDGQLVGQWPMATAQAGGTEGTSQDDMQAWRARHKIGLDPKTGKWTRTFSGIRLPRHGRPQTVAFSAYAFNDERVKSATARTTVPVPKDVRVRQGRAYVVTVGVNAFESAAWNLTYAADDATQLGKALLTRLQAIADPTTRKPLYEEVVWVRLVSEAKTGSATPAAPESRATKALIRAVIDKLAGKTMEPQRLAGIENADKLAEAHPEDLVVVAFSTHGGVDEQGRFYVLPQDIGANATAGLDTALRKRAISSEELADWLRDLDAGELVLIVDACHSAASVQNKEFKPGPMGSRGLGQLAYDKGMRILAATQVDQYAFETQQTKLGLLTYALVRDGLEAGNADYKPEPDGRILLSEWLSYGATRVPGLYREWREGKLAPRVIVAMPLREPPKDFRSLQQPALFDFARHEDPLLVGRSTKAQTGPGQYRSPLLETTMDQLGR